MNKNGAFRKRKVNFSQVSNIALRDKNLSLKAKGLYSLICSYITLEDFTLYKDYLISLSSDKKDSFNRVWDELKSSGYLIQYNLRNENGQYIYEYELLDEPRELTDEEKIAFEKKEANRIARNKRKQENSKAKKQPQPEIPPMEKSNDSIDGYSRYGNSIDGKTVPINNTDLNNTNLNNTTTTKEQKDVVVQEQKDLIIKELKDIQLSDDNIETLLKIADVETIIDKIKILHTQSNVHNVLGFLISAIKNDYQQSKYAAQNKQTKQNKFVNYEQRDWDFDELKKLEREYVKRKLQQ